MDGTFGGDQYYCITVLFAFNTGIFKKKNNLQFRHLKSYNRSLLSDFKFTSTQFCAHIHKVIVLSDFKCLCISLISVNIDDQKTVFRNVFFFNTVSQKMIKYLVNRGQVVVFRN